MFVYIAEAHAINEWPIRSARFAEEPVSIKQSVLDEDRELSVATYCTNVTNMEKYVAPVSTKDITQNFEIVYKPWPFRIFGFIGNVLSFASEPKDQETVVETLFDWIKA